MQEQLRQQRLGGEAGRMQGRAVAAAQIDQREILVIAATIVLLLLLGGNP